jgi:hypothetical protein
MESRCLGVTVLYAEAEGIRNIRTQFGCIGLYVSPITYGPSFFCLESAYLASFGVVSVCLSAKYYL